MNWSKNKKLTRLTQVLNQVWCWDLQSSLLNLGFQESGGGKEFHSTCVVLDWQVSGVKRRTHSRACPATQQLVASAAICASLGHNFLIGKNEANIPALPSTLWKIEKAKYVKNAFYYKAPIQWLLSWFLFFNQNITFQIKFYQDLIIFISLILYFSTLCLPFTTFWIQFSSTVLTLRR